MPIKTQDGPKKVSLQGPIKGGENLDMEFP